MNKDLYITLLEGHVDDLSTAMKIDTVLSLRKTERIRGLKSEMVSSRDWNNVQDELISKIADTAMDYQEDIEDIEDLRADSAEDYAGLKKKYREILEAFELENDKFKEKNTRANDEIVLLRSKGTEIDKDLQREVFQLNKQNNDLRKQINEAVSVIATLKAKIKKMEESK